MLPPAPHARADTAADPTLGSIVSFALMGAALLPMLTLVNTTPDRIPADVILEGQEQPQEQLQGLKEEKA